jgi:hypothetical protein
MAKVLLEAKAAALHPKRYQSSLSKLSTKKGWLDRKVMDKLKTDRQVETG